MEIHFPRYTCMVMLGLITHNTSGIWQSFGSGCKIFDIYAIQKSRRPGASYTKTRLVRFSPANFQNYLFIFKFWLGPVTGKC